MIASESNMLYGDLSGGGTSLAARGKSIAKFEPWKQAGRCLMAMLKVDGAAKRLSVIRPGHSLASWPLSMNKTPFHAGTAVGHPFQSLLSATVAACAFALLMTAQAEAQWTKEDTAGLTASSDWSPGTWTTATTTGTMTFDTTLSANNAANLNLAANASYTRLNFGAMNGPVIISGTRTMTLTGASTTNVDMSAASHDVTIDVFLNAGANGGSTFTVGSGRILTLSGGGSIPANPNTGSGLFRVQSSTARLYTLGLSSNVTTGDTTNNTGGVLIGNNSTFRTNSVPNGLHIGINSNGGLLRVDGSGAAIDINVGNVRVGRTLGSNLTGKLLLTSGSIFNSLSSGTGTFVIGFGNTSANSRSIFEMQGGAIDLPANFISILQSSSNASTTSAEYSMKGGTALTRGLRFGVGSTSGTGVLNMTGGALYLGTDGIQHLGTSSAAYNIILASGTLGAAANWTSSLNMRMREAFVIMAADAGGTARNVELSGTLSNDGVNQGGFIKRGAGTLTLSGSNSYTGATTVDAGTLTAASNALANTSSIAVNGAYLSAVNYNPTASLALGATGSAAISGAGLSLGAVTNANTASNALDFTGNTGTITVASLSGAGSTRFQSDATITGGVAQGTINATGLLTAAISGGSVTAGSIIATGVSGGSVSTASAATITTLSAGSVSVGGVATITTMSGGTVGLNGVSASITTLNGGRVDLANNVALSVQEGTFGGTITGAGSLLKTGVGTLVLSGSNTYTGLTQVSGSGGALRLNGSVAGSVQVDAGAILGGSGLISGNIGGDGLIGPGNSPGILTVQGQVDPTATTSFAFEFMKTGDPIWSTGTASENDVLRLTNADPFLNSLTGSNTVNIYFEVASLSQNDTFRGGFFSDFTSTSLNFATEIGSPTYAYYVLGSGSGGHAYGGKTYYTLSEYLANNSGSGITGVTASVATVASANFSSGTVTNGQVTQFVIVPEPDTVIFAGIGIAMAGWSLWKRGRIVQVHSK
jgi:autotransporter-associated beta strand protein